MRLARDVDYLRSLAGSFPVHLMSEVVTELASPVRPVEKEDGKFLAKNSGQQGRPAQAGAALLGPACVSAGTHSFATRITLPPTTGR